MAAEQPGGENAGLAGPAVFVLFGATGDLARRMVLPAFCRLAREGLLPSRWVLVGNGRGDVAHEDFRARVRDSVGASGTEPGPQEWDAFARRVFFAGGGFSAGSPGSLLDVVGEARGRLGGGSQLVHYLAVPPAAFAGLTRALGQHGLARQARVVYEKPFGTSRADFRRGAGHAGHPPFPGGRRGRHGAAGQPGLAGPAGCQGAGHRLLPAPGPRRGCARPVRRVPGRPRRRCPVRPGCPWAGTVVTRLDASEHPVPSATLACLLTTSLEERPFFCDLLAHAQVSLEREVSAASVGAYKIAALNVLAELAKLYAEDPSLAHAQAEFAPRMTQILDALITGRRAGGAYSALRGNYGLAVGMGWCQKRRN